MGKDGDTSPPSRELDAASRGTTTDAQRYVFIELFSVPKPDIGKSGGEAVIH
jgi:hypothetical protein